MRAAIVVGGNATLSARTVVPGRTTRIDANRPVEVAFHDTRAQTKLIVLTVAVLRARVLASTKALGSATPDGLGTRDTLSSRLFPAIGIARAGLTLLVALAARDGVEVAGRGHATMNGSIGTLGVTGILSGIA